MTEDRRRIGAGIIDVCVADEVTGRGADGLGDKSQILIIGNAEVVSSYIIAASQKSIRSTDARRY